MCRIRMLVDQPVTMRERESGLNVNHLFEKSASEAEVLAMHINGAEPHRKKKAITKIFRRSTYLPKLADIEEHKEMESSELVVPFEKSRDLSLAFIHLERAMGAGVMAHDSRRRKRKSASSKGSESPRRERRHNQRSHQASE